MARFGKALKALEKGKKVARKGWNGKNMWITLVPGTKVPLIDEGTPYHKGEVETDIVINSHIDMCTAQGTMQPGWLASQADMLAKDWVIL